MIDPQNIRQTCSPKFIGQWNCPKMDIVLGNKIFSGKKKSCLWTLLESIKRTLKRWFVWLTQNSLQNMFDEVHWPMKLPKMDLVMGFLSALGGSQRWFTAFYRFSMNCDVIKFIPGNYCPWKKELLGVIRRDFEAAIIISDEIVNWGLWYRI